jgi:hypothetical protein
MEAARGLGRVVRERVSGGSERLQTYLSQALVGR